MISPFSLYPFISRLAGLVLCLAGALKAQIAFSGISDPVIGILPASFVAAIELVFGLFLLGGLFPRWSRLLAIGCFLLFLHVALAQALANKHSCGCFGKLAVRPWYAVGMDGFFVLGLLVSPPRQPRETLDNGKYLRKSILFLGVPIFLAISLGPYFRWMVGHGKVGFSHEALALAQELDADLVETAIQALERNQAELKTLIYTVEYNSTNYPSIIPGQRPLLKDGKIIEVESSEPFPAKEEHYKTFTKCLVRGEEIRSDYQCLEAPGANDRSSLETLVAWKGRMVQWVPGIKQAWLMTAEVADSGRGDPIDFRCAGLIPPVKSIGGWLRNAEIRSAGKMIDKKGREIVRIQAFAKGQFKEKSEVILDCHAGFNYLPVRVVHRYPSSAILKVADLDYLPVNNQKKGWFPHSVVDKCYLPNTTNDPDAATGFNILSHRDIKVVSFGGTIQDEEFNILLPPRTNLIGDLAAKRNTGENSVRAFSLMRETPLKITNPAPGPPSPGKWFWVWAGGMDLGLAVACLVFRKQVAL